MSVESPSEGDSSLLDSNCESRTPSHSRDSGPLPEDWDSDESVEPENWDRQHKRTFHRVQTLLSYWDQHGYEVLWITLTSGPESDGSDRLAYNHRRLRQTVERAHAARDADGKMHDLQHVREIESLVVRTSEGPDGHGVLHLFWAWDPPGGSHSRDFFVPHDWLSRQWGRIHGPYDEHSDQAVKPLYVWIKKVGSEDYHSTENLARYLVSQYLGDHTDALENVSWSWERTLGGSVTEAWEAVRGIVASIGEAIATWHDLLGGEEQLLSSGDGPVERVIRVRPPPDLGVVEESFEVDPPPGLLEMDDPEEVEAERYGDDPEEARRRLDPTHRKCPECGRWVDTTDAPGEYVLHNCDQADGRVVLRAGEAAEVQPADPDRGREVRRKLEAVVDGIEMSLDGIRLDAFMARAEVPPTFADMAREVLREARERREKHEKARRYLDRRRRDRPPSPEEIALEVPSVEIDDLDGFQYQIGDFA